jgi:threonine/homoserine/homoserine lactone efflux protein
MIIEYIAGILFGAIIGLASAVPVGPVGVICIQRTILKNRFAGLMTGFGATLADGIFAVIGAFSITVIIEFIKHQHIFFRIAGGIILIILAIISYKTKPKRHSAKEDGAITDIEHFLSGFLLTMTNPLTAVFFLFSFAAIGSRINVGSPVMASSLVVGTVIGALIWWLFLTYISDMFGHKIHETALNKIGKWFGIILFVFGVFILGNVLLSIIF